jgi:hypothetical protein
MGTTGYSGCPTDGRTRDEIEEEEDLLWEDSLA